MYVGTKKFPQCVMSPRQQGGPHGMVRDTQCRPGGHGQAVLSLASVVTAGVEQGSETLSTSKLKKICDET